MKNIAALIRTLIVLQFALFTLSGCYEFEFDLSGLGGISSGYYGGGNGYGGGYVHYPLADFKLDSATKVGKDSLVLNTSIMFAGDTFIIVKSYQISIFKMIKVNDSTFNFSNDPSRLKSWVANDTINFTGDTSKPVLTSFKIDSLESNTYYNFYTGGSIVNRKGNYGGFIGNSIMVKTE